MTLKTRFSLAFIGYTLAVLSLFGATYYILELRSAIGSQKDEQIQTVEKLASVCREMHLASNAIIALNFITVVKKDPAVMAASCVDAGGIVQAHSDSRRIGRGASPDAAALSRAGATQQRMQLSASGQTIREWSAPVLVGGNQVGWAQLEYDRNILDAEIRLKLWTTLRRLMAVASSVLVLAVLTSLALAWSLSRPIRGLVEATRAIGAGNLDYQTPIVRRSDELGFLAQEINAMAAKLKELDGLKDDFISSVSHDLRGPLGSISMYAEHLKSGTPGPLNERQNKMLDIIGQSAVRLGIFINTILDAAKIKAHKMEYVLKPAAVSDIIGPVIELLKISAARHHVFLGTDLPANIPAVRVDAQRIEMALSNLVVNSLKFTREEGRIVVGAKDADDAFVELYVADTGIGIAPDKLAILFRRFQQADVMLQKEQKIIGTGLGLFLLKQTVDAHGGKVWLQSEVGRGTIVHFTLPKAGAPSEAAPREEKTPRRAESD
ncbi:MAG TPA: hypothetical protein DEB40_00015 [Elusimicrobia bacterium]|nr:hypothetical protein [Elusimicrobiota bacterium]